jgi:toxin ParE1/3/4
MHWSIYWSDAAEADLEHIWFNIAPDDMAAADRLVDRIVSAIGMLAEFPRLGRRRDDVSQGLLGLARFGHIILYEARERQRQIVVERIIHGKRDIAALFHQPE